MSSKNISSIMFPHALSSDDVLHSFDSNSTTGLTQQEAQDRTAQFGKNVLPEKKRRSLLQVFLGQFRNPLIYLLFIAAFVTLFFGQKSDPLVVLGVVLINAIMGTVQEGRAERSIHALRKFTIRKNRVLREGKEWMLDLAELVPGDILLFSAGDVVGADCRVIEEYQLEVDESSLTGEPLPISKQTEILAEETFLADRSNMLFMGTFIIAGRGKAVVIATGLKTEMGNIVKLAEAAPTTKTPIEYKIDRFGKWISIIALIFFFGFVALGLIQGLPKPEIILAATSQLVSIIPEGLPIAITIALAVGVQRMASHRAIVRKLVAVETLGSTNVICADKTGTLTKNEMTVKAIVLPEGKKVTFTGNGYSIKGDLYLEGKKVLREEVDGLSSIFTAMSLCNDAQLQPHEKILGDPTEAALLIAAKKGEVETDHLRKLYPRTGEIPFDSIAKTMVTFHQRDLHFFAYGKGALEVILSLCKPLRNEKQILELAAEESGQGRRILGFALFENQHPISNYAELSKGDFLGFVTQQDPARPEVYKAVEACHRAQIKPVMITGDHAMTARAIAKETGIDTDNGNVIEGKELEHMTDEQLMKKAPTTSIFARVHPTQKLRIVDAYQRLGYVVAMTGDGVNDAPALAKADVGVVMGISGTEVAKEAAKMIILDDHFATIVEAVREGRVVYNNLKKVIFYLLSTSFSMVVLLMGAVALGYPLPLAAVQILWINVITEGTVTINLIMEPAEGHEMSTPPTRKSDGLLGKFSALRMLLITPLIGAILLGYFIYGLRRGEDLVMLQTEVFSLLAFCAWFNVLNCRSYRRSVFTLRLGSNKHLLIGILLGIVLHMAVLYIPTLSALFRCVPLGLSQLGKLLGIASCVLWVEEIRKFLCRQFSKKEMVHHAN